MSPAGTAGSVRWSAARTMNPIPADRRTAPTRQRGAPSLISVVIPVRNAKDTLLETLGGLSRQSYPGPWEVVVVDDGSTDGSGELAREWAEGEQRARVVDAPGGRGAAHVRNAGARAAHGDFIAFCDADDVPHDDWLSGLARAAGDADLVGGRTEYERLSDPLVLSWHPERPRDRLPEFLGFLPTASGANAGIWRDVFETLGGFDQSTASGEDVDLSWRAQLASFTLGFGVDAVVHYRYRPTLGGLAAQYYKYGKGNAWLFSRYGSAGMPASGIVTGLRRWLMLARGVRRLRSNSYRGSWVMLVALSAGRLAGSVRRRTLYL